MQRYSAAILGTMVLGLTLGLAADTTTTPVQNPSAASKPAPALRASHAMAGKAQAAAPRAQRPSTKPAAAAGAQTADLTPKQQDDLIGTYCLGCHDADGKAGGLSLEDLHTKNPDPQTAELMIHKLRASMMPPSIAQTKPPEALRQQFAATLEHEIDAKAGAAPNPGRRTFQRLNRAEYARAVKDLLGIDVDVTEFLPPDTMSAGFDNIADAQAFSPTLLDGYLRAATKIAGLAVGNRNATPGEVTYKIPRDEAQLQHVDGAPWGTRGGISVVNIFPADGDYTFTALLHGVPTGELYGSTSRGEKLEISINGKRVALLDIDHTMSETGKNGLNLRTAPIHVQAGPQRVSAAFLRRSDAPVDDLLAPIDYTLADTQIGDGFGVTTVPHLRRLAVTGPFRVTGVSDTVSRERIFTCRPTSPDEEGTCAQTIIQKLAAKAYRGPVNEKDVDDLLRFYDEGRKGGDFESGVTLALQAMLSSPRFLFRLEMAPTTTLKASTYRIGDLELANRLSYFLWDDGPDAELLKTAEKGTLHTPTVLDAQVHRMLKDPRAMALSTRFASQWLRLQDIDKIKPDALQFPSYDYRLAQAYKKETELLFNSIVQDDSSLLDLLTANYTFVNERLARHYGIPNVTGDEFRRVTLPPSMDYRRGLLGQGSILMLTSVANRTSPVQRGKWVMEVLLNSPPPPPPPNVPALDDEATVAGGKPLSVRERMEEHRKNPMCASCHRVIDPLGLALENFDVTGAYRIKDNGVPVDAKGVLYDGETIDGPEGLRKALLNHSTTVLRTFTDYMMAYALGRRVEYFDQPTVRAIVNNAAKHDYRFSNFVLGIVNSPAFQMSKTEPVKTTDAVADNTNQSNPRPAKGSRR